VYSPAWRSIVRSRRLTPWPLSRACLMPPALLVVANCPSSTRERKIFEGGDNSWRVVAQASSPPSAAARALCKSIPAVFLLALCPRGSKTLPPSRNTGTRVEDVPSPSPSSVVQREPRIARIAPITDTGGNVFDPGIAEFFGRSLRAAPSGVHESGRMIWGRMMGVRTSGVAGLREENGRVIPRRNGVAE
jgi:hypothetical protein